MVDVTDTIILSSRKTYSKMQLNPTIISNLKSCQQVSMACIDEMVSSSQSPYHVKNKEWSSHEKFDNNKHSAASSVNDSKESLMNNADYSLFGDIDMSLDFPAEEKNSNFQEQISSSVQINKNYQRTRKNLKEHIGSSFNTDEIQNKKLNVDKPSGESLNTNEIKDKKLNADKASDKTLNTNNTSGTKDAKSVQNLDLSKLSALELFKIYQAHHNPNRFKNVASKKPTIKRQKNKTELTSPEPIALPYSKRARSRKIKKCICCNED